MKRYLRILLAFFVGVGRPTCAEYGRNAAAEPRPDLPGRGSGTNH